MLALLPTVFVVVGLAELFLLIRVGDAFGVANMLVALLLLSATGAWLVKREGLEVVRRARLLLQAGRVPGRELVDGAMILFAGALLLTPGFLTDIVGLALLVPPVRSVLRATIASRLLRRASIRRGGGPPPSFRIDRR